MPVVTLYWDELRRLVGKSREEILKKLPMLGCDIERVEDDHIDVEFFPNRPDLYSIEGVARALRSFLDVEHGYRSYEVKESNCKIFVEQAVLSVRPRIVGCIVRDIELSSELIRSLMDVQEDLHWTIGRNRRKMAIGVHELSRISFPLRYTAVDGSFSFVPLDFSELMSVKEILAKHPKGKEYGFILKDRYPMIIDSTNEAISFPPIINAEKTRVKDTTKDLFIEVTGLDENVDKALNILAAMLAERGGVIEGIEVIYPDKTLRTPNLIPRSMKILKDEISALLGFKLSDDEIMLALKRMGFGIKSINESIEVLVPPYRADIMHEWDVIEDIAIGYGYDKIQPEYPPTNTIGGTHPWNEVRDDAKEIMVGLGYLEVITFTLTNERIQYQYMQRKAKAWKDFVPLMHPLTEDHTIVRTDILPKLLELLSFNKHHLMPQRVFEVGDVIVDLQNALRLAACSTHAKANFAEVRSVVQAVMKEFEIEWEAEESDDGAFIEGRRADITVNNQRIGVFGEVHPQVLENFQLLTPVVAFEIDLSMLFDVGDLL
jgi:phenylalanyl-tRNA synthetase beta chain